MPFTFSHPAIILPLSRIKNISMSALVIGSIAPDFDYFIRMKLYGALGHSLKGIFLLDLPIAIVVALLFHQLVKKPMINSTPSYVFSRLIVLRDFEFISYLRKHYIIFLFCLLAGIISHLLWDSITHATSPLVNGNPFLTRKLSIFDLFIIPLYRLLQHISTLIGAIITLVFFHRLPTSYEGNNFSIRFWLTCAVITAVAFVARLYFDIVHVGDLIVSFISAGFVGLICASIVFYRDGNSVKSRS